MDSLSNERRVATFPSVRIAGGETGAAVEVTLIAQLGVGQGDGLAAAANHLQRGHGSFVDALDEPSARIGAMDLERGDRSSLYTFAVGPSGHPFHRHAGPRVFTAVSGSSGALLRFSQNGLPDSPRAIEEFLGSIRQISVPPDSLFTVRFGGGTWHQFLPLQDESRNPALFALSFHTDETAGELSAQQRSRVLANTADIAVLTETLPDSVAARIAALGVHAFPTTELSLAAAPGSLLSTLCSVVRRRVGFVKSRFSSWRAVPGFESERLGPAEVQMTTSIPAGSLLAQHLASRDSHDDYFSIEVPKPLVGSRTASNLLAGLLEGFVENRPVGVSGLMRLRNVLVAPLGLRRSRLGCPVSSLLGNCPGDRFEGKYPVLDQRISADAGSAEVILGADDRHLRFRSVVAVEISRDGSAKLSLGSRVLPKNLFGKGYLAAISYIHRRYVSPLMLRLATAHALKSPQSSGLFSNAPINLRSVAPAAASSLTPPQTHRG